MAKGKHFFTHTKNFHPIVLSSQNHGSLPYTYSYVSSDNTVSMNCLLTYFKSMKRSSPALYGVNLHSLSNMARRDKFLTNTILPRNENNIYINSGSLEKCFESFEKDINNYDCIICANDYAALHLKTSLNKRGYNPENFLFASYGETNLANMFFSDLITVSTCYSEFGKAALNICDILSKNSALLYLSLSVKPKLSIDADIDFTKVCGSLEPRLIADDNKSFYSDKDIRKLIVLENMLEKCDETDKKILKLLLSGRSYEEASEACFISLNTVKYRTKQMYELCGCSSKKEFLELFSDI